MKIGFIGSLLPLLTMQTPWLREMLPRFGEPKVKAFACKGLRWKGCPRRPCKGGSKQRRRGWKK